MTSLWKKPWYTPKQQEQNWLNSIWQNHDNFCSCGNTWRHLLFLINKDSQHRKPLKDIDNILCLLIGKQDTKEDGDEKEDPGFFPGELEKLFQEDGDENATEDANTR